MKKTFPLQAPGKADARVLESVKDEVRRYVKREHRKPVPEGFHLWAFDCAVGPAAGAATGCALGDLNARIDDIARAGHAQVHIEIVAQPGKRILPSE